MDRLWLGYGPPADELLNHRDMLGQVHTYRVELRFVHTEFVSVLQSAQLLQSFAGFKFGRR